MKIADFSTFFDVCRNSRPLLVFPEVLMIESQNLWVLRNVKKKSHLCDQTGSQDGGQKVRDLAKNGQNYHIFFSWYSIYSHLKTFSRVLMKESKNLWTFGNVLKRKISPLWANRKSGLGSKGARFGQKTVKITIFFQLILYLLRFNDVFKGFDERKSESMNLWLCFEKQITPLGPNRKSGRGQKVTDLAKNGQNYHPFSIDTLFTRI